MEKIAESQLHPRQALELLPSDSRLFSPSLRCHCGSRSRQEPFRNQGKGAGNALFVLKLGGEKVGRYDMQMDVPHRFDLRGRQKVRYRRLCLDSVGRTAAIDRAPIASSAGTGTPSAREVIDVLEIAATLSLERSLDTYGVKACLHAPAPARSSPQFSACGR
jgi:hypothetical protein